MNNLGFAITADSSQAVAGLRSVAEVARQRMDESAAAVDTFRARLDTAAANLVAASKQIGSGMQAANDAIVGSSRQSELALARVTEAAQKVDYSSVAQKAAAATAGAFGAGFAATQTWLQKTEEFVTSRTVVIAGALIAGIAVGTALAVYSAYAVISGTFGFLTGLLTGTAYKSSNIDALIAANKQVQDLQNSLSLSVPEAQALGDALARLGVDKADYASVWKSAESAMRTNGDELDRLGVRYKTANGQLLDTQTFLRNVREALDGYTAGWSRNAAAAAIGAGSYQQITEALKVSRAEIDASRERLADYNLLIGSKTQQEVARYQQAMRDFANETRLTSEGFKRAIADNIMPVLTDLAVFFRDGFPFAVNGFRYSMATITSLLYGLKTVFDIVVDTVKGAVIVIGSGFMSMGQAAAQALSGNLTGAADTMRTAWTSAGATASKTFEQIVADSAKNRDRMAMAWGLDGRNDAAAADPKGKTFNPKPDAAASAGNTSSTSAYQTYLDQLDQQVKKLTENEYASMRLKATRLAEKEGITDLAEAYRRINAIQGGESQRVVDDYTAKQKELITAYRQQTDGMTLGRVALEQYTASNKIWTEIEQAKQAAIKAGKPLTDDAIAALRRQAAATDDVIAAEIRRREDLARAPSTGITKAVNDYRDAASDGAANAAAMFKRQTQGMEDAVVKFAQTGKLSFKDLFSTMAEEFLRQQTRMVIADFTKTGGSGWDFGKLFGAVSSGASWLGGAIGGLFGGGVKLAEGTNYVPYDGFRATLHEGEAVVPKAFNAAAGGMAGAAAGQGVKNIQMGDTYIGSNISRAEVVSAQRASEQRMEARIRRLEMQGVFR